MNILRRLSLSRLLALCAGVVVAGTGVAFATSLGGSPKPAPQPLASAIHDALAAPKVDGVSANISFTNHLISSSSVQGSSPLLNGANGRLWASKDGKVRLELQANNGDIQIVYDGQTISYLDAASGTVYRFTLPRPSSSSTSSGAHAHSVPTVDQIQSFLTRLMQHVNVSAAVPDNVAGRPAYHVTISPRHDGGLLGSVQLWWDAVHGVPLRIAVYAAGRSDPVLELTVTHITFGPVSASVFTLPSGGKTVQVRPAATHGSGARTHTGAHAKHTAVTGAAAAQRQLPFTLSAPGTLAGLSRSQVRLLDWGGHPAALVTYGQGFGGLAVVEMQASKSSNPAAPTAGAGSDQPPGHGATLTLPKISINGSQGTELVTALGTVVRFQRGGVDYIVAGSVPASDAENAARGL